ncbi:MAG: ADP-ribosylglycohydrolase family protein [Erysipelotrichaceae bacterium]|nr:ADP-ribosylglycohydrolase family protein [Erysipelotrichaceae bacterium]
MKAWEKELEVIQSGSPCYEADDNETIWEEQSAVPEEAQDALTRLHFHSQVPGSRAHESICTAAIQAMENRGYLVEGGMDLIFEGFKAYDENRMVDLHSIQFDLLNKVYNAKKDENSPYWKQTFYNTFEEYAAKVNLPKYDVKIEDKEDEYYASWLSQIIGGAYGTCIEGYTGKAIKEKYGEVSKYVRKPNTYNDDDTYELALLEAYKKHGKDTNAIDIAREWVARIPTGWSAEEWALNNLRMGIMPPESGRFHNPFNEWIGAQMRGAICGQLYPGNLYEAARSAWMDASISHDKNGILGEVFNALMVSLAFVKNDTKEILKECIELIPEDSEYGQVIRFAYEQCESHDDYYSAWLPCEKKLERYNWIHAYPNAAIEVIAMYYGENDFVKTLSICGGCGQDVDCNAAQIMTIIGIIKGSAGIPDYYKEPFGDEMQTCVRGLKKISIRELAKDTQNVAIKLQ